jgi:hypothetical protein
MDIFNKKKIKELERDVSQLWANLCGKERELKELKGEIENIHSGDAMPEYSNISYIFRHLYAIEDYLEIDMREHWIDDPCRKIKQPQIKVLKAMKKNINIGSGKKDRKL